MMIPRLLLGILLFMGLVGASGNSGTENPCPDPVLQCPNKTVEGKVGDTVILPCSAKDKADISYEQIEWVFKDPTTRKCEIIHTYHQGKEIKSKIKDNRTSLFMGELSSGNCSLSLKVTTSDSGTYYCFVYENLYCTVTLKVLQRPNTPIEGKVGDRVILPCSTEDKTDISHEHVEWFFEDPATGEETVHLYYQGEDFLLTQRKDFKNRTSLFKKELSSGNLSLSLLVDTSHSGRYHCYVAGHLSCTVALKVRPKAEDTSQMHQEDKVSPDKPNNGKDGQNKVIGGAVGVVVIVAALIIVLMGYRYREQLKTFWLGIKPNKNPPIYQEVPDRAQQPPQHEEDEPADQNPNEEQSQMIGNEDQGDPADGNEPADGN